MSVQLQIPDSVAQAIRLPEDRIEQELRLELAIALYAQGLVSFAKARELADKGKYAAFGQLLGERQVARHYGREELEDDLAYARGESYLAYSESGDHSPACAAA
jgi:predicted HTH domain antitoxin